MVTASSVWKKLKKTNAQLSIGQENFRDLLKLHETSKLLLFTVLVPLVDLCDINQTA